MNNYSVNEWERKADESQRRSDERRGTRRRRWGWFIAPLVIVAVLAAILILT